MSATPTASQQFQRAIIGQPFQISYTWGFNDEALPDADSVSVAIVDADGDTVATSGLDQGSTANGQQTTTANIAPGALTKRTQLTVTWTYTINAVAVEVASTVDVCDGRLFPLADYSQFNDAAITTATPEQLETARREAEDFLERECGCAFTGRYRAEQHLLPTRSRRYEYGYSGDNWGWLGSIGHDHGQDRLVLEKPDALVLRGITRAWVDPESDTSGTHSLDIQYVQLDTRKSTIYVGDNPSDAYWGLWGDLTIAYEYGRLHEPDVRRICLILARYRLVQGPLERRAQSIQLEGGGSITLAQPGSPGIVTGIPEVDTFIARYSERGMGFLGG